MPEPDSPGVVYDLRRDTVLLSQIREGSLSDGDLGLAVEAGIVVGSAAWWAAVQSARVRVERFIGVIRGVDCGPMGDSLIVRIDGGRTTRSWMAWEGFDQSLVGKRVDIR